MIHHISVDAKNPKRVASIFAEIMGGQIFPAPPNFRPDSWFVFSGDEHGTMIEVLPAGTEMWPDEPEAGFRATEFSASFYVPTHAYISVPAGTEKLLQIGQRENWLVRECDRGPFKVVEFWVENRQLVEFAPPEMSEKYVSFMTDPEVVKAAIAQIQQSR